MTRRADHDESLASLRRALTEHQILVGTNVQYGAARHQSAKRRMAALDQLAVLKGRYPSLEVAEEKALGLEIKWNKAHPVRQLQRRSVSRLRCDRCLELVSATMSGKCWHCQFHPERRKPPLPWIVQVWIDALEGCWSSVTEVFHFFGRERGT